MALPSSGILYMSQIQAEFGGPNYLLSTYYRGGGYVTANNTGIPASGPIYFSQFYGAQKSVAGSRSFTSPGTYSFTVPVHSSITFDVRAAGGGGGGSTYDAGYPGNAGANGGSASVSGIGLSASGGGGGAGSYYNYAANGSNGSGSGGNQLNNSGGGSGGAGGQYGATKGGNGGNGGRAVSTWEPGSVGVGATLTVTVPSGGGGGAGQVSGQRGNNGAVYISWT